MNMNSPNNQIIKDLMPDGAKAYIVGGFIRDKILDVPTFDIDYAILGADTIQLAKAFANIILATAPNINKLLKILLETPSVYLLTGIMQAKYQFQGRLSAFDRMIVFRLGLLPEPCGVAVEYEEILQGFPLNGTILLNGTAQLGN